MNTDLRLDFVNLYLSKCYDTNKKTAHFFGSVNIFNKFL